MSQATSTAKSHWLCAGLLVVAGLLTVVGTVAPRAKLKHSTTDVFLGSWNWNGFGGDVYEVQINNVVFCKSPGVAKSLGYITLPLGLAILLLGFLRLKRWTPSINRTGKIAAVSVGAVASIVAVLLFVAINCWVAEVKEKAMPRSSTLEPSFGLGIWILLIGAIIAVVSGFIWPSRDGQAV